MFSDANCGKHVNVLLALLVEFHPIAVAVLIFKREFEVRIGIGDFAFVRRCDFGLQVDILGIGKHSDALGQLDGDLGFRLVVVVALIVGASRCSRQRHNGERCTGCCF